MFTSLVSGVHRFIGVGARWLRRQGWMVKGYHRWTASAVFRIVFACVKQVDLRLVHHENIPTLPASDWSIMRIYLLFYLPDGSSAEHAGADLLHNLGHLRACRTWPTWSRSRPMA
eukprot:12322-Prorocentrum_minimum.AAC.3